MTLEEGDGHDSMLVEASRSKSSAHAHTTSSVGVPATCDIMEDVQLTGDASFTEIGVCEPDRLLRTSLTDRIILSVIGGKSATYRTYLLRSRCKASATPRTDRANYIVCAKIS